MKISFIATVFNEEKTIDVFLDSLFSQTKLPDEIIIVDGGSSDQTVTRVQSSKFKVQSYNVKFKIIIRKGNRSVGRNEGIRNATGDIILSSDAGCILDKRWVEKIIEPFKVKKVDVVAGYYRGKAKTVFEKCLIPYVLVMPNKVNPEEFLPSTRSIAFKKLIWKKVGGFDETFSHNEDYVFAHKLKNANAKIGFQKDAIVHWTARKTFKESFIMFFRFAMGDTEAGIWRAKVLILFARYILALYFIFLIILYKSLIGFFAILILLVSYILWSIIKNYRYVKKLVSVFILPMLQFTADAAVLSGTIIGLLKRVKRFNYLRYGMKNKFLFFIIAFYIGVLLVTLNWGIPNNSRPFPYHMDEWHQLQAVANTFRYGTPNIAGSANGTMFHFILSGFYLVPFSIIGFINPFELQIDNLFMRERVFEVLRLQTILFGVLSIFVLYKITELIEASKNLAIFLFTFTPIWIMLSGYFKYDIALMFWILLSVFFILRFAKAPSNLNFLLAAIPTSLAIAVKISAIPLLPIYIFSYFWFSTLQKKNLKDFFIAIVTFLGLLLLFGFPDTLFGRGNIILYLFENIIQSPNSTSNFEFGMNQFIFLFTHHYPIIFGHGLLLIFIFSVLLFISFFIGRRFNLKKHKIVMFLFFSLVVFLVSILPLQIYGGGNRSLVILPFFVLIIALIVRELKKTFRLKVWVIIFIFLGAAIQFYESLSWIYMRTVKSPQEISSVWIEKNIEKGETIGIENVPIYQSIPDVIKKEFYFQQYGVNEEFKYKYRIVDIHSRDMPSIIVISNGDIEKKLLKSSSKKDLLERIEEEDYKMIANFVPNFKSFNIRDKDLYFSWLIAVPNSISVFEKSK